MITSITKKIQEFKGKKSLVCQEKFSIYGENVLGGEDFWIIKNKRDNDFQYNVFFPWKFAKNQYYYVKVNAVNYCNQPVNLEKISKNDNNFSLNFKENIKEVNVKVYFFKK